MPPLDKYYDYSQYEGLKVEKQDKVMTITLNEPEAMNAFSMPMHYSFSRIWEDVQDDPEVNVIVLTGAGRAFSAGGNVIAMQQKIDNPDLWDATSAPEAKRIIFRMLECDKPIIARVNGHAVGLGATVALMCDIIIAADTAKIGDPHVSAGLVAPGYGDARASGGQRAGDRAPDASGRPGDQRHATRQVDTKSAHETVVGFEFANVTRIRRRGRAASRPRRRFRTRESSPTARDDATGR